MIDSENKEQKESDGWSGDTLSGVVYPDIPNVVNAGGQIESRKLKNVKDRIIMWNGFSRSFVYSCMYCSSCVAISYLLSIKGEIGRAHV